MRFGIKYNDKLNHIFYTESNIITHCNDELRIEAIIIASSILSKYNLSKGIFVYYQGQFYYLFLNKKNFILFVTNYDISISNKLICVDIPPVEFLNFNSTTEIYVPNISINYLNIIGNLLLTLPYERIKAVKIHTSFPNTEILNYQDISHNQNNIPGFHGGRIAYYVANNYAVINKRFNTLEQNLFSNYIITKNHLEHCKSVYLMELSFIDNFFEKLPYSIRTMGSCIPITIENNELFSKLSNCKFDKFEIRFITKKDQEDLQSFMKFYNVFSGKIIVSSTDITKIENRDIILYHYDRSYFTRNYYVK